MTRTATTQRRMKCGLSCELREESFVLANGGPAGHPEEVAFEIGVKNKGIRVCGGGCGVQARNSLTADTEAGESRKSPEDVE